MKIILLIVTILLSSASTAAERIIELSDGSLIRGDVIAMQNNSFTVRTELLGTINLKASQIVDMRAPGASSKPREEQSTKELQDPHSAIASIESRIVNNTGLITSILRLQDDPQMKAILNNPELMQAIQNLDFDKLSTDPRIKALMNNPMVKEIQSSVH